MKLLILSAETGSYECRRLEEEALHLGFSVELKRPFEVDINSAECDVLLVRSIRGELEKAREIAGFFLNKGVTVVDEKMALGRGFTKMGQYVLFKKNGLFAPVTMHFSKALLHMEKFKSEYLVVKPLRGKKGENLFKVKKSEFGVFANELENPQSFLVQDFVPIKREYRLITVGNKVLGAFEKVTEHWIHNISRGAVSVKTVVSPEIEETALKAAKLAGNEICGIDLGVTENGFFVIEANRSPGFEAFEKTCNLNVAKEIIEYLKEKRASKNMT
jgi:RimK family alpha-L-glutamate ligase